MGNVGERRNMLSLCSVLVLLLAMGSAGWTAENESVQQYKMRSVLEYSGKTQFCNKVETVFTAKRHLLDDGKVKYVVSADEVAGLGNSVPSSLKELSFVVDRKTQHLSGADKGLALMEKVTNQCAASLKEVSSSNVGKTWKQTFDLSSIGNSVPGELRFTLTAIPIETRAHGELIAVRALSEPFQANITGGTARCRMNCAYVFCSDFEDIFMSASVFGATTNCNGYGEGLKHTVTTWKVDAAGQPAEFDELGKDKDFAKLVSKLGVTKSVEVVKAAPLPQWARSDGIRTAQVANLCASVSCEGALNPVATIYLPAASAVGLQGFSESLTLGTMLAGAEGSEAPTGAGTGGGGGAGPLGGAFDFIGWNAPTAVFGTGLGFGIAGAAGAFDDDDTKVIIRTP
ncbi:MAG: hypothetical protein ACYTE3_06515 [Planctomycetota bacterium]